MSTATLEKVDPKTRSFDYGFARIKELSVQARQVPSEKGKGPKTVVDTVSINGETLKPSKRFWTSIQCRFGFSHNIFRYFNHAEVFNRISERAPNDQVRYCIENDKNKGIKTLLAVTNPTGSAVHHDQLQELLGRYGAEQVTYADGIVRSTHKPRLGANAFKIGGDEFSNQFVIDTPIDGFGRPNIYLSLLRMICSNGAVGYGKAFRSELSTGKTDEDVAFALVRAMDGFNNEEGFTAMRDRFNAAQHSWASVNEVQRLYKALAGLAGRGELARRGREHVGGEVLETASPIFHNFHKMSGDIASIYGLTNLDSLSTKRQRTLPAACKVYDLLNFATEVATHQSGDRGNRSLQAYVGDVISNEYDLEGTVDQFSDWQDFFVGDENTADTMRLMHSKSKR